MINEMQNQEIQDYWQSFLNSFPKGKGPLPDEYQAWSFGNSPGMADSLGDLVIQGFKTATASLVWWYEAANEPFPEVGEYSIILNSQGQPLCIIQTTELSVQAFNEVDDDHAYLEGEGDRSLRYWREAHWDFFSEECAGLGKDPHEKMPVLCERFKIVYIKKDG
jgi:uncharacterized protein YhfF